MISVAGKIKRMFAEIKEDVPNLNHLTLEISSDHLNQIGNVYGFYHVGDDCEYFSNIDELCSVFDKMRNNRRKNEILFRKF